MNNILNAIKAIVENSSAQVKNTSPNSANRANRMGDALEDYVKSAFADCLNKDDAYRVEAWSEVFSYLGNSSNPPDAMIRGGDAIEVKKLSGNPLHQIQLNSSYPKNKFHSDSTKISKECRYCEEWNIKDMLYVIGNVKGKSLHDIFLVYGDLYCDSPEVYERVQKRTRDSFKSLQDVEFVSTKELGRVNKVDHLGISNLRIRGMWLIDSPFKHFAYLINDKIGCTFRLIAIIPEEKYCSFDNVSTFEAFCHSHNVHISNVKVQDPQNPANLIKSKLIIYRY